MNNRKDAPRCTIEATERGTQKPLAMTERIKRKLEVLMEEIQKDPTWRPMEIDISSDEFFQWFKDNPDSSRSEQENKFMAIIERTVRGKLATEQKRVNKLFEERFLALRADVIDDMEEGNHRNFTMRESDLAAFRNLKQGANRTDSDFALLERLEEAISCQLEKNEAKRSKLKKQIESESELTIEQQLKIEKVIDRLAAEFGLTPIQKGDLAVQVPVDEFIRRASFVPDVSSSQLDDIFLQVAEEEIRRQMEGVMSPRDFKIRNGVFTDPPHRKND